MPAEGSQLCLPGPSNRGPAGSRFRGRPGKRLPSMTETAHRAINITLNGEPYRLDGDAHLLALVERLGLKPNRIAVEINHEVVAKACHAETVLREGDVVEIINFVGGG
jgi:sulfur carrier protein